MWSQEDYDEAVRFFWWARIFYLVRTGVRLLLFAVLISCVLRWEVSVLDLLVAALCLLAMYVTLRAQLAAAGRATQNCWSHFGPLFGEATALAFDVRYSIVEVRMPKGYKYRLYYRKDRKALAEKWFSNTRTALPAVVFMTPESLVSDFERETRPPHT